MDLIDRLQELAARIILLDDSNRKPLCRLYFNTAQKYLGLFDSGQLERVPIDDLDDIYTHADRLKAAVARHDNKDTATAPAT